MRPAEEDKIFFEIFLPHASRVLSRREGGLRLFWKTQTGDAGRCASHGSLSSDFSGSIRAILWYAASARLCPTMHPSPHLMMRTPPKGSPFG
jgi:hypothetical protein